MRGVEYLATAYTSKNIPTGFMSALSRRLSVLQPEYSSPHNF
jgi:hypothetical protein